ncbi:hypothetical protein ACFL07_04565 [Pseudomonadota bacterium]
MILQNGQRISGQILTAQTGPAISIILGAKHVGIHVRPAVIIENNKSGASVMRGCSDHRNPAILWCSHGAFIDTGPAFAAVPGYVDTPVIGSDPERPLLDTMLV